MDNLISNLLLSAPTGLWERIITGFEGGLGSFALSIVLLTIIIKIIMSPIDFFNKRTSRKMQKMQAKIQPQIDAINKKYAKDDKLKNQKLGELYQRERINPLGSCGVMLVSMGLTLAIFITLFNGMNAMASYKIANQYEQLQIAYVQEYAGDSLDLDQKDAEGNPKSVYEICLPYIQQIKESTDENVKNTANANVVKKYKETKESFLWIENIWIADNPFKNSIPSYSEYASVAKLSNDDKNNEEYKAIYEQIMNPLRESTGRVNGFFVLTALCAGLTLLNQWLMNRKNKGQPGGTKWGMTIFITALMTFFTLLYTTMFSLYMITGQIVSLAITPLVDLINDKIDQHQEKKKIPADRLKRI